MALEIAPEKVAHVIIKAREYDVKVGAWDDTPENGDAEEDPSAILSPISLVRRAVAKDKTPYKPITANANPIPEKTASNSVPNRGSRRLADKMSS